MVVTSLNRDDLDDGRASVFVDAVREIRQVSQSCAVELLTPDFSGDEAALQGLLAECPEILNHNIETVRRLFPSLRPQGKYDRLLEVLARGKRFGARTRSGLMIGLGETQNEVREVMCELWTVGCEMLTIGQCLQPTTSHAAVEKFYTPEEFAAFKLDGFALGFNHVESGPLVRSSHHAAQQANSEGLVG